MTLSRITGASGLARLGWRPSRASLQLFARIVMATAESGNPSARADAVTVRMWCEVCPGELELCLAHHKGQTMLRWRRPANGTMDGEGESDER